MTIKTDRDSFRDALNHIGGGRLPVDFGATAVTGMHVSCVSALRDYYGLEKAPVKVVEPFQMLGEIGGDLKQAIGVSIEGALGKNTMFGFANEGWKPWEFNGLDVLVPERFNITGDGRGGFFLFPQGERTARPSGRMPEGGVYFDAVIRQGEIDDDRLDPEDNLEEFQPLTDAELSHYVNALNAAARTGRGVILSAPGAGLGDIALVPGLGMIDPKGIRDVEEWYVSTVTRRDYLHTIFERQTDIAIDNMRRINDAAGGLADAVFLCGTDFGTQTSTFCSRETFRELYMPYYKKMTAWIRANTNWKVFKHSCGAIETLLDDFIEAGFDIINPVQCSATGMDPREIKEKYGEKLVFWGAGVDTQRTLPFGTAAEVRDQVTKRCGIFAENGGFVFNAIHNVQAGTPVENIVAMIDAVKDFNSL